MRPIQLHLLAYFRPSRHSVNLPVPTTPWLTPHLQWWVEDANLTRGRVFRPPRPSATVITDASLYGWGATLDPHQIAGVWGPEQHSTHIKVLEMLAVQNALQHFRAQLVGQAVLVRSDNPTVVAYINHQGGTGRPGCVH